MLSRPVYRGVELLGEFSLFVGSTVRSMKRLSHRRGLLLQQCELIGVSSLGVIVAAAIFMGAVMGYQFYVAFHWFGMEPLLGASIGVALFRDLASMMTAIMVTGRAGAAIAAELSSMRISEQIDALEVMAVDPFEYLVAPRVVAGLMMMPFLAVVFAGIASIAAAIIACGVMGLSYAVFWDFYVKYVDVMDLVHCLVKAAMYGLVITWIACFWGFRAKGGAKAVGFATRTTVVVTFLAVLLSDYFLTTLLPMGLANLVLK